MLTGLSAGIVWLSMAATLPTALDCPAVKGAKELLRPGTVVLLGEFHGTREAPAATEGLVCQALAADLPVTLGLEIPLSNQTAMERYLAGSGSSPEPGRPLESRFWQREYQDGRASQAMLKLVEKVDVWRRTGHPVDWLLIDDPQAGKSRDQIMAERVSAAIRKKPDRLFVILTGNIHNRLTRGTRWNPDLEPMGYRLRRMIPEMRIVSLNMMHRGGSAWFCTGSQASDCGIGTIKGTASTKEGIQLFEDSAPGPYSGRYFIGAISASRPAAESFRKPR